MRKENWNWNSLNWRNEWNDEPWSDRSVKWANSPGGSVVKNLPADAGDLGSIPGGENGNSFQYSCLENHMDREAWQTTVHGVAKSWTRLSNWERWQANSAAVKIEHRGKRRVDVKMFPTSVSVSHKHVKWMRNGSIAKKANQGRFKRKRVKSLTLYSLTWVKEREKLFENYQDAKAIHFYLKSTKISPKYLSKMCLPSALHPPPS